MSPAQPYDDAHFDTVLAATPPTVVQVTAPHTSSPWTAIAFTPPPGAARCHLAFDAAPAAYEVRFDGSDTVGFRVPANTFFALKDPLALAGLTVEVRTTGGADLDVRALVSFPAR